MPAESETHRKNTQYPNFKQGANEVQPDSIRFKTQDKNFNIDSRDLIKVNLK
jgi:hypothetical protein